MAGIVHVVAPAMLTLLPLTRASPADYASVLRIFLESPSYVELHEGRAPSEADAEDFFDGKPDSKHASDKTVYGLYVDGDMIGCADAIAPGSACCSFPSDTGDEGTAHARSR
jgi:hypothetical protein